MYNIKILCASLSVLSLMQASALAQPDHGIQVTAKPVTVVKWAQRTGQLLDRSLARTRNWPAQDGIVAVKFICNDAGVPTNIALLKSSGSKKVDDFAVKAVGRIPTLHPLPEGVSHGQKFVATVLIAQDQNSYWRQMKGLRQSAQQQNEKFNQPTTLALGVGLLNEAGSAVQVN